MIFEIEPASFPINHLLGQIIWNIFLIHPLTQLQACSSNFGYVFGTRLGFQVRCWKRSKWGSIPRKASHKCEKIKIWRIEFQVKWCAWIPQWKWRPWKKSLVGIAKPSSIKAIKIMVSLVSSYGRICPRANHYWATSCDCRMHSSTRDGLRDLGHLLALHPSSSAASLVPPALPFPLLSACLGAIRMVANRFSRIHPGAHGFVLRNEVARAQMFLEWPDLEMVDATKNGQEWKPWLLPWG